MLEKQIQTKLKKELERQGWTVLRPINVSKSGFPDLWCLQNGTLVFVEVKKPGEKPTALQHHRHKELQSQGFQVVIASSTEDIGLINSCLRPNL